MLEVESQVETKQRRLFNIQISNNNLDTTITYLKAISFQLPFISFLSPTVSSNILSPPTRVSSLLSIRSSPRST